MAANNRIKNAFAPSGTVRATINYGNPILAYKDATGAPAGISVDLARRMAKELNAGCELVTVDAAADAVKMVSAGGADFGFFAIDPLRAAEIAFTDPYIVIEGNYLVRESSSFHCNRDVDQPRVTVAVGTGSAYDLFLTRELKAATIVRGSTSPEVVSTFLREGIDVAAGVRQQLEADAAEFGNLRLLEPHFMLIKQAMGVARSRGSEASAWLAEFVTRMKASGFVAEAMRQHGVEGAVVAD